MFFYAHPNIDGAYSDGASKLIVGMRIWANMKIRGRSFLILGRGEGEKGGYEKSLNFRGDYENF